jgi:RNA polymerase sigma factor (sigma-70 family)
MEVRMGKMDDKHWLTARFEEERLRLHGVAFRMLGTAADADDAVQEAWIRLDRTDVADVDNLAGWLTTVVARVSLNMLRSRENRRSEPWDERTPEIEIEFGDSDDPEQQAVVTDSVSGALMMVLDTLSPSERVAFVLHDVFGLAFDEIAPMIDRSSETARQCASRARRRLRGSTSTSRTDLVAPRRIVNAFFDAARNGNFDRLLAVLDPEVTLRVDAGPNARTVICGADEVAGRALMFADPKRKLRPVVINGGPGVAITVDGTLVSLMAFTVSNDRVTAIDALGDAGRLAQLVDQFPQLV